MNIATVYSRNEQIYHLILLRICLPKIRISCSFTVKVIEEIERKNVLRYGTSCKSYPIVRFKKTFTPYSVKLLIFEWHVLEFGQMLIYPRL